MSTTVTDPTTGVTYERRFVPATALTPAARAHHTALRVQLEARGADPLAAIDAAPLATTRTQTRVGPSVPLAATPARTTEAVHAEITALAERLQRAQPQLTLAEAYTAVLEGRPDLYAAHEHAYWAACASPPPQTEGDDPAWDAAKRAAREASARARRKTAAQAELSHAEALAAVFREDPALYAAYVHETTQAAGGQLVRPIR